MLDDHDDDNDNDGYGNCVGFVGGLHLLPTAGDFFALCSWHGNIGGGTRWRLLPTAGDFFAYCSWRSTIGGGTPLSSPDAAAAAAAIVVVSLSSLTLPLSFGAFAA